MKTAVQEALRYTAVSACALCIDVAILWLLVDYFSWRYLGAATISFLSGLFVTYSLSLKLVFKHRRLKERRLEFASFAAIGAVGLAINATVISFAVKILGLQYLIAKCVAAAFTFVWNFTARRQMLFIQRPTV